MKIKLKFGGATLELEVDSVLNCLNTPDIRKDLKRSCRNPAKLEYGSLR